MVKGNRAVISRIFHAFVRALFVAVLVALPSLVLPGISSDGAQIVLFTALLAGLFVFVEYASAYPSLLEFRDAAPFNRMRYAMAFLIVGLLTALCYGKVETSNISTLAGAVAATLGGLLDVPLSPVRLLLIAMPDRTDIDVLYCLRDGAALSYAIALAGVGAFYLLVRVYDWPARNGAFNVWVNLPLFDPTTGGDVVPRLRREGQVNVALGALLPFVIPALAAAAGSLFDMRTLLETQSFVWSLAAWSFLPASMMMRGIAMCRIAELIEAKRQRAYARAEVESSSA